MATGLKSTRVNTRIADKDIILETGKLANQADGGVWVQSGDTVVLVTAVTQPLQRDIDFMPLVVDYQEMSYATGKIPGSYFRREIGRPSERETLVSRLIDRPIRPLFPEGFKQEVQIIATVLSADPDFDPDVLALTGASTALQISRIPFDGPIAGARVGYVDDNFVLNPTQAELAHSQLNLIIAASSEAVVMVEGGAQFCSEELVADGIFWGQQQIQPLLQTQHELRDQVGAAKIQVPESLEDREILDQVRELAYTPLKEAISVSDKIERRDAKNKVKEDLKQAISERYPEEPERQKYATKYFRELESEIVRNWTIQDKTRIDGRSLEQIRELGIEVGLLPRVHGSSVFARGETKALGAITLGGSQDEQHIESLAGELSKRFMVHYNFPPYCVGEVKMMRGPSRREIGHGVLAERSLLPVLPNTEDFPFTIRLVSEIMESNGSSSMATVCAGSMALMDAGVPISAPIAGIAMGLIKDGEDFHVLTDIMGDEDHLGDMDFKVAGSREGITGIQMDIKVSGISRDILVQALAQGREARLSILDQMSQVLDQPRQSLSEHAPQLKILEVAPDKIKDVIGPGGKNIKAITKETGASIDIEDSGQISIFAPNSQSLEDTIERVLFYDQKPELNKDYQGRVKSVKDFGAFVEILPGVEGLVHISQLDKGRVEDIHKFVSPGEELTVKVIEIEQGTGKIRLSRKAVLIEEEGGTFDASEAGPRGGGKGGGPNKDRGPKGRGGPNKDRNPRGQSRSGGPDQK
ncbi:MAG: polyribonucleotide nucleotidyltransferase [Desulfohalobiaceae bacterium]|nr:polyribonucleotide nucleotidyltransferase [Desulfohalobiaceae bacterium]